MWSCESGLRLEVRGRLHGQAAVGCDHVRLPKMWSCESGIRLEVRRRVGVEVGNEAEALLEMVKMGGFGLRVELGPGPRPGPGPWCGPGCCGV